MKFPINQLLISFINILEVAGVASAEEEGTGAVDPSVAAAAGEVTAAVEASRGAVTAALAPVTRATRRAAAAAAVDMEAIAAAVEERDIADQAPVENGNNFPKIAIHRVLFLFVGSGHSSGGSGHSGSG